MRVFEFVVLLKPDLSDEQLKESVERIRNLVEQDDGAMLQVNFWGKKRLAYEVKKYSKGYYVHLVFVAKPGLIQELERTARINENIIKFLTVKLEDRANLEELREKYPPAPTPFDKWKEEEQGEEEAPEISEGEEIPITETEEDSEPEDDRAADETVPDDDSSIEEKKEGEA